VEFCRRPRRKFFRIFAGVFSKYDDIVNVLFSSRNRREAAPTASFRTLSAQDFVDDDDNNNNNNDNVYGIAVIAAEFNGSTDDRMHDSTPTSGHRSYSTRADSPSV